MRRRGILELGRPGFARLQTATIHLSRDYLVGRAVKVPECHGCTGRHGKCWRFKCHPANNNELGRKRRGRRGNIRRSGNRGRSIGGGCLECSRRNRRRWGRRRRGRRWRCVGSQWGDRHGSSSLDWPLLPHVLGLSTLYFGRRWSRSNGQDDGRTSRWRVATRWQRVKPRQGTRREHEHAKTAQQRPATPRGPCPVHACLGPSHRPQSSLAPESPRIVQYRATERYQPAAIWATRERKLSRSDAPSRNRPTLTHWGRGLELAPRGAVTTGRHVQRITTTATIVAWVTCEPHPTPLKIKASRRLTYFHLHCSEMKPASKVRCIQGRSSAE